MSARRPFARPTNRLATTDDEDWRKSAACIDQGDLFFMTGPVAEARAKAVCHACPVIAACREWAIADTELTDGVAGALTPNERRDARRRRGYPGEIKLAPCTGGCGKTTRSSGITAERAPDTVARHSQGMCRPCFNKAA